MEREYVLGTHDEEIERLGLQHRVWRPRASLAWRRAGFTVGQTIVDVGCGPGYASLDLAEIVGPSGTVWALDRSRRFLDVLEERKARAGIGNVRALEIDLDEGVFPDLQADGAWIRWVLSFVKRPRDLVARIAASLRPGGVLVLHEYYDYRSWRMAPPRPAMGAFVEAVMKSWRADGGEPDVGLYLPGWLADAGFLVEEVQPILEVAPVGSYLREWPRSFLTTGLDRLVALGHVAADQAAWMRGELQAALADPGTLVFTPAVLEIRARRI